MKTLGIDVETVSEADLGAVGAIAYAKHPSTKVQLLSYSIDGAEPILVDLGEDGRTYELLPHQGEEFGYVLSGSIFLVDGETKTRVRAGSSFCLHPHETHYLMNAGKFHAKVLWISTPPSF